MTASHAQTDPARGRANRWWIYQRARFPLFAHGPLVLAFSLSALCYSSLLRGGGFPGPGSVTVAFGTAFFAFLHLRLADEFKDFEQDAKFRPELPVPSGLVTLRELGFVWGATALAQLGLALWLEPLLVLPLAAIWCYLALMGREFCCREWLRARPVAYMATHMAIVPMIDFFATACDWMPSAGLHPPAGLFWFLAASYLNGFVIEIGRKIRAPEDERPGVETYTVLWGQHRAVAACVAALLSAGGCGVIAAATIGQPYAVLCASLAITAGAAVLVFLYFRTPTRATARWFEIFSGGWTLAFYLALGIVPSLLDIFSGR